VNFKLKKIRSRSIELDKKPTYRKNEFQGRIIKKYDDYTDLDLI